MILNLSNLQESEIKYIINKYPDGQQDVVIAPGLHNRYYKDAEEITIKSRLNSFKDLELIICATQALRKFHSKNISLYIPYLLGARSDRKFVTGGVNYLKDVIAPIINSQRYYEVIVIDPHSDATEAVINNLKIKSNLDVVLFALQEILK